MYVGEWVSFFLSFFFERVVSSLSLKRVTIATPHILKFRQIIVIYNFPPSELGWISRTSLPKQGPWHFFVSCQDLVQYPFDSSSFNSSKMCAFIWSVWSFLSITRSISKSCPQDVVFPAPPNGLGVLGRFCGFVHSKKDHIQLRTLWHYDKEHLKIFRWSCIFG